MFFAATEYPSRPATIPAKLKKRIFMLAREDEEVLEKDRAEIERFCLRQHHRRIWQNLRPKERALLKGANADCAEYDFITAFGELLESR